MTPYFCPRCEVWGKRARCWCCDRSIVIRTGPPVDAHVDDTPADAG